MLKKIFAAAFVLALSLSSSPASASFVYTDWQATGDKKALLDSSSGKEWLRFSQTGAKSINDITNLLSTTYAGWRLPTNAEVVQLVTNIYGGLNLNFHEVAARGNYYSMYLGANRFASWLGNGNKTAVTHGGLYYDEDGKVRMFGTYMNEGGAYTITVGLESSYLYSATSRGAWSLGVFLVSDGGTTLSSKLDPTLNVNNPSAPVNQPPPQLPPVADVSAPIGLGAIALLLIAASRRRKGITG